MSNRTRYAIVMIACAALNIGCYALASHFGWPVWLDTTGTALAAVMLEPAAGLIVGLANNFVLSVFVFDASSMVFYAVSAAVALLSGLLLKKEGRIRPTRALLVIVLCILVCGLIEGTLTLLHGGLATAALDQSYEAALTVAGWPRVAACYGATMLGKAWDVLATAVLFTLCYQLTPKSLRNPPANA